MAKKLIYVCSPLKSNRFTGDISTNIKRATEHCRAVVDYDKQYLPIAPHIYFTKFLDDNKLEERQLGLVFGTYVSSGMMNEISLALEQNMKVKFVDANLALNKINNRIRGKK